MPDNEDPIAFMKKRKSEREVEWETISLGRVFPRWPVISIQQVMQAESKGIIIRDRRYFRAPSENA